MRRRAAGSLRLAVVLCASFGGAGGPVVPEDAPLAAAVDPFIGTLNDGQTFPGAVVPWGMASPSPHNARRTIVDSLEGNGANAGYLFGEPKIYGFGVQHLRGVGCPESDALRRGDRNAPPEERRRVVSFPV